VKNADCTVVNGSQVIATLDKGATFSLRIGVTHGRGYVAIDKKENRDKIVGKMYVDSIFSPCSHPSLSGRKHSCRSDDQL
jgi:DNA-directed RNA polymerase alpha subunit